MIAALLWDVDGVLVDTEPLHYEAWRQLLNELGHNLTLEQYVPLAGLGGHEIMAELCTRHGIAGDQTALRRRRWEIYLERRRHGIAPIADNVALVRAFAQTNPNLRQLAVSSSTRANIRDNLALVALTDVIGQIVSYEDQPGLRRKPAPDLYLLAVERAGRPTEHCLAFEDSAAGVAAAKAASLRCVALPNAITIGQDFSPADLVIAPAAPRNPAAILRQLGER